ncbi:MAG: four helix bundle protein [Anaerolineae bacterium]|nr:four helix bundle protein [Anaerolineae bacterium]
MGQITRFEDLIAWQIARSLTKAISQLTQNDRFIRDFGLSGQIQRAAVSIMSNMAEGFERDSKPDFHRFLTIAKASCAEVRSQLYIALDIGYLQQPEFHQLMSQAEEVARVIGGLPTSLRKER